MQPPFGGFVQLCGHGARRARSSELERSTLPRSCLADAALRNRSMNMLQVRMGTDAVRKRLMRASSSSHYKAETETHDQRLFSFRQMGVLVDAALLRWCTRHDECPQW
jgi:hypothetical protein